MANLTISVDDETLKRARIRAIEQGESVNRVLAERLREYADTTEDSVRERQRATLRAIDLHAQRVAKVGDGRRITRSDIYEERLSWYDR